MTAPAIADEGADQPEEALDLADDPEGDQPPAAALELAEAEDAGPRSYKVSQGVLFMKRAQDPGSKKIVKVDRPLGAVVHSTGRLWTGPGGGRWAEVDLAKQGERGWALVEGPGFGVAGPALVDAALELVSLQIYLLSSDDQPSGIVYETLAAPDDTVGQVKQALCAAKGLKLDFCCLSKDLPALAPGKTGQRLSIDYMPEVKDHQTLADIGFGTSRPATLLLVYVADLPAGLQCRPAPMPRV